MIGFTFSIGEGEFRERESIRPARVGKTTPSATAGPLRALSVDHIRREGLVEDIIGLLDLPTGWDKVIHYRSRFHAIGMGRVLREVATRKNHGPTRLSGILSRPGGVELRLCLRLGVDLRLPLRLPLPLSLRSLALRLPRLGENGALMCLPRVINHTTLRGLIRAPRPVKWEIGEWLGGGGSGGIWRGSWGRNVGPERVGCDGSGSGSGSNGGRPVSVVGTCGIHSHVKVRILFVSRRMRSQRDDGGVRVER